MTSATGRYYELLKNIREFMAHYDMPKQLEDGVMDYVASTWSVTKGIDANSVTKI